MKTNINVYLSSTDFQYDNDPYPDFSWKSNLIDHFHSKTVNKEFDVSFHDPLQNISDKAEIVEDDITHIIHSDFVVVYLPKTKLSIGTIMEIQYSCLNKPKDCVILIDRYKVHRKHPWIKYWVKHIVDDEDEAVTLILNILGNPSFTNLKER